MKKKEDRHILELIKAMGGEEKDETPEDEANESPEHQQLEDELGIEKDAHTCPTCGQDMPGDEGMSQEGEVADGSSREPMMSAHEGGMSKESGYPKRKGHLFGTHIKVILKKGKKK